MAVLQPGHRCPGSGAVAGEHQGPGGPRHRVGGGPVQQAHPGGDGAGGEDRADDLGRSGGDREGREVLVEVPGRDDQVPRAIGAVVSHGHQSPSGHVPVDAESGLLMSSNPDPAGGRLREPQAERRRSAASVRAGGA